MSELEGAYGRVVSLKDSFKVECQSIPQGEFSARRACQYSSAFRRPLVSQVLVGCSRGRHCKATDCDHVHGTTNFICGSMDKLGAERC
jgi:hypothetical protein